MKRENQLWSDGVITTQQMLEILPYSTVLDLKKQVVKMVSTKGNKPQEHTIWDMTGLELRNGERKHTSLCTDW